MRLPAALAALAVLASPVLASAADPAAPMAAHRAMYALSLDPKQAADSDVVSGQGTMGYEVIDACDGWAMRQRLDMTITNRDGQDIHMLSDYVTWESKDGLAFRFHMKQTTDDAVTAQTDGDAKLDKAGGAGSAHYTTPKDMAKALPAGTLFPMAHTEHIIDAARAGAKFISVPLFDGTDDSGVQDSFIVILDWQPPEGTVAFPLLKGLASTRVHLTFFDRDPPSETPDYEVGMRYWENGVADALKMNFGDFTMDGKLTELAPQPRRC